MFLKDKKKAEQSRQEEPDTSPINILRETLSDINEILTTPKIFLCINLILIIFAIFLGRFLIHETDLTSGNKPSQGHEAGDASPYNEVIHISNLALPHGVSMAQETIYTSIENPDETKKIRSLRMGGPIKNYIKNNERKALSIAVATPYGDYSFPLHDALHSDGKVFIVNRSNCRNISCILDVQINLPIDIVTPRHGIYSAMIKHNNEKYGVTKDLRYNTLADKNELIDFTAKQKNDLITVKIKKTASNAPTRSGTYAVVFDYTTEAGSQMTRAITVPSRDNIVTIKPPPNMAYGGITVRDVNYLAIGGNINKVFLIGSHPLLTLFPENHE